MSTICICNDSFDMTRTSGFVTLSLSVLRYFRRKLFTLEEFTLGFTFWLCSAGIYEYFTWHHSQPNKER